MAGERCHQKFTDENPRSLYFWVFNNKEIINEPDEYTDLCRSKSVRLYDFRRVVSLQICRNSSFELELPSPAFSTRTARFPDFETTESFLEKLKGLDMIHKLWKA